MGTEGCRERGADAGDGVDRDAGGRRLRGPTLTEGNRRRSK